MPGQDAESRKRGRIEKRGNSLRVRVYAGDDPVTGRHVYRNETVRGTDRLPRGEQVRAVAAETAGQIRGVLAELADPGAELSAHPGTRSRLEGAALALEVLARGGATRRGARSVH
jgi:hypothetical protein